MKRSIAAAATLALLALNTAAHAVVYNYTDTTFTNVDWNGTLVSTTSTPPATFFAGQFNVGGSALLPGPQTPDYRGIRHNYGGLPTTGAIIVGHEGVNFDWTPLPLEVAATVDYSYDLNYFDGPAGSVGFAPAIFQGGNVYRLATFDLINGPQSGWVRFTASGIPLAGFQQVDPATALLLPGTPNALAAMSFGFVSANSANGVSQKFSGIDDYRFTLNTVVTPEPATLGTLAIGAMLVRRRRAV